MNAYARYLSFHCSPWMNRDGGQAGAQAGAPLPEPRGKEASNPSCSEDSECGGVNV